MFVNRIEIENIRSFKTVDLGLSRGINVVAGANNAGKSTLLKSFYLLQEPFAFRDQDLRINSNQSGVRIILEDISARDALLFQEHSKGSPLLPSLPYAEIYFPRTQPVALDAYYASREKLDEYSLNDLNLDQRRERYKQKFPHFPTLENKGNFIYPFFSRRRGGFLSPSAKDDDYQVFDDFRNLASKVQKVSNQRVTKERFAKLCDEILGFQVGIYQGENGENRIAIHVGYNKRIPLESMGEGTANILGLITLLLTQNNKLFLLEELENDIHPLALKKILALIIEKSRNNQFIVSTHSNIVLKYLGSEPGSKLFFANWSFGFDGSDEDFPISTVSEITNSPEKRMEVLERLGYEPFDYDLYKGYLIIEESSAEKIILDFIIPHFVPELQHRIKTVASQGVNNVGSKFHSFNSLFMYLHRTEIYRNKAWVLVDGDAKGKELVRELQSKYPEWNQSNFLYFEQPYFELYYPEKFGTRVSHIAGMKHGLEKQNEKKLLLDAVLEWTREEPEEARREFQGSAAEIIALLKKIGRELELCL